MKKIMLSAVVCTALIMSSCGAESDSKKGEEEVKKDPMSEMCECFDMAIEMTEKMKEAGGDADKMTAIQEEYKAQSDDCDKAGDAIEKSMKDMTDEDKEAKEKEMMDSCPAMKKAMEEMKG